MKTPTINIISGFMALIAGGLTIITGDTGLGLLWIVVGAILWQLAGLEGK